MAKKMCIQLKCSLCDAKCKHKTDFLSHLETHGGTAISCLICHSTFNNLHSLKYHKLWKMCAAVYNKAEKNNGCSACNNDQNKQKQCLECNKKNKPKLKQCLQCYKTFRFRLHYDKHVKGHKRNNCRYCSALLANRKELVLHMAEKHQLKLLQEARFPCKFCGKTFVKRFTLYNHYNQHANGKFVCLSCGLFFKMKDEFTLHQKKHDMEKQWRCERCKETFIRRQQYLVHMKGHEKYRCKLCGEDFAVKRKLMEHERLIHQVRNVERHHQCPACGRSFLRPGLLELHYRIHTGELPLQCKQCNKSFRTPRGYLKHRRSSKHESDQTATYLTNKCEVCNKHFNKKQVLDKHMIRVHSNGKNFQCEFCDHKFGCKENMKRHAALHTERRQFVCEQCGAAFNAMNALKDHNQYVHSHTRCFTCAKCGKSFKRNSGLNRHMSTHSDNRPFVCDCGRSFKRASHLNRHKESVHGNGTKSPKHAKLGCDESRDLVHIVEENMPSVIKDTSRIPPETHWHAPSTEREIPNPILSLVDGGEVTLQELCASNIQHTMGEDVSLAGEDGLATITHCTEVTQGSSFHADVMHAIEVAYDLNAFPTPESLPVIPNTESQIVFTSPIAGALESHTILSMHSDHIQTAHSSHIDSVQLQPILDSDGIIKHSGNIFIRQVKHENVGSVLMDPNTTHLNIDMPSSLYIPTETLNTATTLVNTPSNQSLVSGLHTSETLLSLQPHLSSELPSSRYPLVSDLNHSVSLLPLTRHGQPNGLDNSSNSLTTLPEYLPHHFSFLNV